MRLHVLGIPHTVTSPEYCACAYTIKVLRLCKMLKGLGHEVFHYGTEGSTVECTRHFDVMSRALQRQVYGDYDWRKTQFRWDQNDRCFSTFRFNAATAINGHKEKQDLLLATGGTWHKDVSDWTGLTTIEPGIGYEGTFAPYRVFESYAWMHYLYGKRGIDNGLWFDAVIPNYFDPADYEYREQKGDYYLYLGRVIPRKGVAIAAEAVGMLTGARLVVAGQPAEGQNAVRLNGKHIEYVGCADREQRRELLAGARALFAPTVYIEPFGGVAVEAQLSGTPVITTDWGAFSETVQHGVTGYRCRTLEQFAWAAEHVDDLDASACHDWALANYGMDRVALMYGEYLQMVRQAAFGGGWAAPRVGCRAELEWLKRDYSGR